MDLDVAPSVPVRTPQKNIDGCLNSSALLASLRSLGVNSIQFSRPKQTPTTQRWKIALGMASGSALATRLEFSRRGLSEGVRLGTPTSEMLRESLVTPFAASFYDAEAMIRQKIAALASSSRVALRDLFDIHHLLMQSNVARVAIDPTLLEEAIEKSVISDSLRDAVETRLMEWIP